MKDKCSDPNFHKNEHMSSPIQLDSGKMLSMVHPITQEPARKTNANIVEVNTKEQDITLLKRDIRTPTLNNTEATESLLNGH